MDKPLSGKMKKIGFLLSLILGLLLLVVAFPTVYLLNPSWFEASIDANQWRPRDIENDLGDHPKAPLIKYGYDLITRTPELIGPLAEANMQYAGNHLTCKSCHLKAGTKAGAGSFVGVFNRFPQFRGRENKIGTLEERIQGCMERSMNGRVLPKGGLELQGMVAYMKWLSEDVPETLIERYKGYAKVELPEIKADTVLGRQIFTQNCIECHKADGQGEKNSKGTMYAYPPLWGPDSFNHGAGMHRVITAAAFIKGNMPYEKATLDVPFLSDEEAYHVAAYINSFPRPLKSDPAADFPDKKLKPVSTPYGPWTDDFSPEQHKYGPFQPIMKFYQEQYGLAKSK